MAIYSHRNGESEKPTVEGWYWVKHTALYPVWMGLCMRFVETTPDDGITLVWRTDSICNEQLDDIADICAWWGPIVPPQEID